VVASLAERCAWGASAVSAAAAHAAALDAKQEEVRRSVKAELEVRGGAEGPLAGFDAAGGAGLGGGGGLLGGLAMGLGGFGAGGGLGGGGEVYGDEDRGPGGRPKRRR
jgi:hypothetical protein